MPLRFAESYLSGRLARRLLLVFVLASVVPVLLTSLVSYQQLMRGADAAKARSLHEEAKQSALTFLSQLQAASAELALANPPDPKSGNAHDPWPFPFREVSFVPVPTRTEWQRAVATLPDGARAPLLAGRTVLIWGHASGGRPELILLRAQLSRGRLALGKLDTRRMLDQGRPPNASAGIALLDSATATRLIRSDSDPVPTHVYERMAAASAGGSQPTIWRSRDGKWRGSAWNLFLESDFASPPLRILICEGATDAMTGLPGLRLTIPMMLLGATAFAAWLAIAQLRRYLEPLQTLTAATRQVGASNFDVEVHIRTDDELSDLGEDFNRMARSLREQHRELQQRAHVDGLTGLSNRDHFRQQLDDRLSRDGSGALLYIDLDEFKKVNDSAGHGAGDILLKEVAGRLRGCVQPADKVARLGGDEFAIMLASGARRDDAAATAARVLQAVQAPILVAGADRFVSASIGVAMIPADGNTVDLLLRNADIAMYQAKERGRNAVAFFAREMHLRMEERISLEVALQGAIGRDELRLHYQPITTAGQLAGVEALVRWARPVGPEVSPSEFIPIAEQSELIVAIGDWVLAQACADFAWWRQAGIAPGYVSINVAPKQLQSSCFLERLHTLMSRRQMSASEIQLEMTESAIANGPQVVGTLARLHDLGLRLALDDFGTGYSSLGQLQRLPFDVVKIDRSFIVGLPDSVVALQLVRTILGMTQGLNMAAVAEGVETEAQRDLLHELGCNAMQGYFFGRPVPEGQIRGLLRAAAVRAAGDPAPVPPQWRSVGSA
ncbi:MAG TPA: EAL domain-containing protein [Steroidobacteraceae bacterium]|nr:EAL domain-containing protein [Steroidobacteraceae bacterium]